MNRRPHLPSLVELPVGHPVVDGMPYHHFVVTKNLTVVCEIQGCTFFATWKAFEKLTRESKISYEGES